MTFAFPIVLFCVALAVLFYVLFNRNDKNDGIRSRLDRIRSQSTSEVEEILNKSFNERVIQPFIETVGKRLMRLAPTEMVTNLEAKIVMAGRPNNWSSRNWLGLQAILALVLPVITLLVFIQLGADLKRVIILVLAMGGIGVMLPNLSLNGKIKARQKEVMKSLPDIMDLLTVSVEAGLSFDAALSKVVEKMPGTLSREFETVLSEVKVGKSKKDALYQMADRIGVSDFRSFASAVIQAEQLGVSLGRVLRIQSDQIRQNRRQRIQEKAMKAPIKMMIPMVVFIFPTIFIVLLGPVVINLMKMFSDVAK